MIFATRILAFILLGIGAVVLAASLLGAWLGGESLSEIFSPFNLRLFITAAISLAPGGAVYWFSEFLRRRYTDE